MYKSKFKIDESLRTPTNRVLFILGELISGGIMDSRQLALCAGISTKRVDELNKAYLIRHTTQALEKDPAMMYRMHNKSVIKCKICGDLLDTVPCFKCWCLDQKPEYKFIGDLSKDYKFKKDYEYEDDA